MRSTVDAILKAHAIPGPWHALPALGVANSIYATDDVVLRIATDHEQAVSDARTESVAAPAAIAAGIRTPRLVAFDDSRSLVDRPYTIWERVRGETLGTIRLDQDRRLRLWHDIGCEIGSIHTRIVNVPDPNGWLDSPRRSRDVEQLIMRLRKEHKLELRALADMRSLARELEPHLSTDVANRFVHDDLHAWNLMCSPHGDFLAVIDWGDAGWGDPSIDFGYMPVDVVDTALAGYATIAPALLGADPKARIAWDQLCHALERMAWYDAPAPDVDMLRRLAGT